MNIKKIIAKKSTKCIHPPLPSLEDENWHNFQLLFELKFKKRFQRVHSTCATLLC